MHTSLGRIYEQLESDRVKLLVELDGLSDAQLQGIPSPGKWSIVYTLAHLVTSERMSLIYMKKKSLGVNELEDSGIIEKLKFLFLQISQRMPMVKFKAPRVVIDHTPTPASFAEVKLQWDATRTDLKRFLESIEEKNVRKKIYKHPIAGRLDAVQGVGFLREHFLHHLPRLRQLIAKVKANA